MSLKDALGEVDYSNDSVEKVYRSTVVCNARIANNVVNIGMCVFELALKDMSRKDAFFKGLDAIEKAIIKLAK